WTTKSVLELSPISFRLLYEFHVLLEPLPPLVRWLCQWRHRRQLLVLCHLLAYSARLIMPGRYRAFMACRWRRLHKSPIFLGMFNGTSLYSRHLPNYT
ncbi:hypothetical protein M0804_004689, partial [Polistes exclamans]